MPNRPNILFIESDSMDGRAMGCMGHPAARTPNLDALAGEGTLFRNAYTNNPICCPSRASMWSGLFTCRCEGWNNYKGLEPGAPTFMTDLERAGYDCRIHGKTDYVSGRHSVRARVTAWTRSARIMRPTYIEPLPLVDDADEPRAHKRDWEIAGQAIASLRDYAAGPQDKPLMLHCGLNLPHPAFRTSRHWLDRIDADAVTIPPDDPLDHPVMEHMRVQKNWEFGCDEDIVRRTRRIYYAMIAEHDAMVGEILRALDESGLCDSTYVVCCSDHGEMNLEHRQYYKMVHYEASARVPMILAGPGLQRGRDVENVTSLVDVYPTLMEMAGLECPDGLDGHSLVAEAAGGRGGRPDWVLSEYHDTTSCTGAFMLRRGPWKYTEYVGEKPLLFNLDDDPEEIANLADSRPEKRAEMDALLHEVVDCEAVDAKVKAYDRASFAAWRDEHLKAGDYRELMGHIHTGFDKQDAPAASAAAWSDADEEQIVAWLRS